MNVLERSTACILRNVGGVRIPKESINLRINFQQLPALGMNFSINRGFEEFNKEP